MLLHPLLLTISLLLFLTGSSIGFRSARRRHASRSKQKSTHSRVMYAAYAIFVLAVLVYIYESRSLISEEQRMLFRATGYVGYHTAAIIAASTIVSITMAYGLFLRNKLFAEGVRKREVLHMLLGILGVASFLLAVVIGLIIYVKTGVLLG